MNTKAIESKSFFAVSLDQKEKATQKEDQIYLL